MEREIPSTPELPRSWAGTLFAAARRTVAASAAVLAWTVAAAVAGLERTHALLAGPVRRLLLGRNLATSLAVGSLGVLMAPLAYWLVGFTAGYPRAERWVYTTWTGTDPQWFVFAAVVALLALGAASAALNSGLLPTALLVAGPVFGAAFTRYGVRLADPIYGPGIGPSLPEATAFATLVTVALGVPLALAAFCLGEVGRRAIGAAREEPFLAAD